MSDERIKELCIPVLLPPEQVCARLAETRGALLVMMTERDVGRARVVELERELERWRHGRTIEGDCVCPDTLERDALRVRVAESERETEATMDECERRRERAKRAEHERDAAIAELDTFKRQTGEVGSRLMYERNAAVAERDAERELHKRLSAEYHDATRRTCRSLASQVETLTAERDRMRPVYEAALEYMRVHHGDRVRAHAAYVALHNACDSALTLPPPTDDESRCAVCGWQMADPIKGTAGFMCRRGDCSMRPRPDRLYAPERAERELKPSLADVRAKHGFLPLSADERRDNLEANLDAVTPPPGKDKS